MQRYVYKQLQVPLLGIAASATIVSGLTQTIPVAGTWDVEFWLQVQNSDATANTITATVAFSGSFTSIGGLYFHNTAAGISGLIGPFSGSPLTVNAGVGSTAQRSQGARMRIVATSSGDVTFSLLRATSGTMDVLVGSNSTLAQVA